MKTTPRAEPSPWRRGRSRGTASAPQHQRQAKNFDFCFCLAALGSDFSLRQGDPARGNKSCYGLLYRRKAGESGTVSKVLAALLDGNAGAAHDMSPGSFGVV